MAPSGARRVLRFRGGRRAGTDARPGRCRRDRSSAMGRLATNRGARPVLRGVQHLLPPRRSRADRQLRRGHALVGRGHHRRVAGHRSGVAARVLRGGERGARRRAAWPALVPAQRLARAPRGPAGGAPSRLPARRVLAALGVPKARRRLRAGDGVGGRRAPVAARVAGSAAVPVVEPAVDPQAPLLRVLLGDGGGRRRPQRRAGHERDPPPGGDCLMSAVAAPALRSRRLAARARRAPRWPWLVPLGVFVMIGMSPIVGLPLLFAATMALAAVLVLSRYPGPSLVALVVFLPLQ